MYRIPMQKPLNLEPENLTQWFIRVRPWARDSRHKTFHVQYQYSNCLAEFYNMYLRLINKNRCHPPTLIQNPAYHIQMKSLTGRAPTYVMTSQKPLFTCKIWHDASSGSDYKCAWSIPPHTQQAGSHSPKSCTCAIPIPTVWPSSTLLTMTRHHPTPIHESDVRGLCHRYATYWGSV